MALVQTTLIGGEVVWAHPASQCMGFNCCIHNPSEHHMRSWTQHLRSDNHGLIERMCKHGIGHPDPDSVAWFKRRGIEGMGIHGCCGECCAPPPPVLF